MKIKMTKGMHAKRILCLGLAAAMALTSVQISPVTVEAKTVSGVVTRSESATESINLGASKYNALEAIYTSAEITGVNEGIRKVEGITVYASNDSAKEAKLKVKVYMKSLSATSLTGFAQVSSDDKVYSGTITVPANSTKKEIAVEFEKPVEFNSAKNILLAMETELTDGTAATINAYIGGDSSAVIKSSSSTAIDLTKEVETVSAATPAEGLNASKPYIKIVGHVHSMRKYEKAAVLNEDGTITEGYATYYVCEDASDDRTCGGIYADLDGTTSTTVDKQVFLAHKDAVAEKIDKIKDSATVDTTTAYSEATAKLSAVTYKEVDENKNPMDLKANIVALDEIATEFAKEVADKEDLKVARAYETEVAGISDVTDTDSIVAVYNMFSKMTDTQKTLVDAAKANKISVAFALNKQVSALEKAVDKIVVINENTDVNTFKDATKVKAVKDATELKSALEKSLAEAQKTYGELSLGSSLDASLDKLEVAEKVCTAIATIVAIKTPVNLASGLEIETAQDAYDECGNNQRLVYNAETLEKAVAAYRELKTTDNMPIIYFLNAINDIVDDYTFSSSDDTRIATAKGCYDALGVAQLETVQKSYGSMLTKYNLCLNVQAAVKEIEKIPGIGYLAANDTTVSAARVAVNKTGVKAHVDAALLEVLEDNEAALAVIKQIDAIGDVTVNSKTKIESARTALTALEAFDKAEAEKEQPTGRKRYERVTNNYRNTLLKAENTYAGLAVVALIDQIGEVTYTEECKARIEKAREAYNALTDDQKALVSNVAVLAQADTQYAAAEADKLQADTMVKLIDAVELPLSANEKTREAIEDAIGNWNDNMTPAQQALVPTAKVTLLVNINTAIDVVEEIAAITTVSAVADKAAIKNAKAHYAGGELFNPDGTNQLEADGKTKKVAVGLTAEQKAVMVENPFAVIDAALDVEEKIDAIVEKTAITMDTKATIKVARVAYDAYVAADRDDIVEINSDKITKLTAAEDQLSKVVVVDLVKKIRAIGTVDYTTESAQKIQAAQAAFDELSYAEKANFTNNYATEYKTFEDAVNTYNVKAAEAIDAKIAALPEASLEAEAAVTAVYSEYNTLTVEQKALVKNAKALTDKIAAIESLKAEKADKDAADAAAKVIDAIGTVDGTDAADAKIAAAQEAFYGLTDAQKKLIADKKDALDKAVQEQAKKKAELLSEAAKKEEDAKAEAAAKEAIAAIGEVTAADEATKAKITKAQIAFYGLSEELQAKLKDEKATLDAAYDKYTEIYIQNKLNEITPVAPTETPTVAPTDVPTAAPTETPTEAPTKAPTKKPIAAPTKKPSVKAPAKVTNVKAVNQKGKKVAVSWKKLPKVAGYQVQISTSKKFTKSTTKTYGIKKYTKVKKTVSKLSLKKKYYVRVRAYNKSGSTVKYGKYSLVKSVTVKK